jgi:hypothetical protein
MTKECYVCKQAKNVVEFNNNKRYKDALHYCCKACQQKVRKKSALKLGIPKYEIDYSKTNKTCVKCGCNKPITEFQKESRYKDGLCPCCKLCESNKAKIYSQTPSGKKSVKRRCTNSNFKSKHGWTLEKYEEQLKLQNNKCAICGIDIENYNRRFSIDHNHKTNKIRELLCNRCNVALGLIKENIETLYHMIDYIKKHNENNNT